MKLYISGYGKMGKMIEKIILSKGIEYAGWSENVRETDPVLAKECVCIDFTTPAAFRENYRFLAENFKAVVVGTTGWEDIRDEVVACFEKCGTPMIWASNFSIGVNVFFAVADYVSRLLGESGGYSPYMVEMHHCHKLDAPSGTALMIAEEIESALPYDAQRVFDRTPYRKKRDDREIGIHSIRGGAIVGEHEVMFCGGGEVISIKHSAGSRDLFAQGAVRAAEYMVGKKVGRYSMKDVLKDAGKKTESVL